MGFSYKYLYLSFFISIVLGVLVYLYLPLYSIKGIDKALEGVLLISSISLGFYGACLSVFASIFNTQVVKEIMNDKEYRKEFIIVATTTLVSGFLTVFSTIVYQVILMNDSLQVSAFRLINSLWAGAFILFFTYNLLFIFVSFLIFFSNSDQKKVQDVHEGEIGENAKV